MWNCCFCSCLYWSCRYCMLHCSVWCYKCLFAFILIQCPMRLIRLWLWTIPIILVATVLVNVYLLSYLHGTKCEYSAFLWKRRLFSTVPEAYCIWVHPSMSECMSLCILKTLWTQYLKNQSREFYPILVTDVNELIDVLISFWVTKSNIKVTAGNDPQKPCEQHISKTNVGSFT